MYILIFFVEHRGGREGGGEGEGGRRYLYIR